MCEELSFRGLGMPLTADRTGLDLSSTAGLAGAELDIAAVFVKIGGYPPLVLRPLTKSFLYNWQGC